MGYNGHEVSVMVSSLVLVSASSASHHLLFTLLPSILSQISLGSCTALQTNSSPEMIDTPSVCQTGTGEQGRAPCCFQNIFCIFYLWFPSRPHAQIANLTTPFSQFGLSDLHKYQTCMKINSSQSQRVSWRNLGGHCVKQNI